MKILAIETTGKYGSASIIDESGALFSAEGSGGNDHLKEMISLIDKVITDAGINKKDLTHVAASIGPGSFTGIRIGVTTARTLAQMLGIECIPVPTLKGMVLRAVEDAKDEGCDAVAAIINARRHQVYAGAWVLENGLPRAVLEQKQYMIEDFLELLKDMGRVYFLGDGIDAYEDIIKEQMDSSDYVLAEEDVRYQHASSVAGMALAMAAMGQTVSYDELMPDYMRLAEAEQRLREGTLSDKIKELSSK